MSKFRLWFCLCAMAFGAGCGSDGPIRIAAVGDLHTQEQAGSGFRNGIGLAEEVINDAGGVEGALVSVSFTDDEGDPGYVPHVDEKLCLERVRAILGHSTSVTTAAALPVVNRNKVLLLSPEATSSELAGKDDYFVRDEVSEKVMAEALAAYAGGTMKLRRVGAILDQRNRPFTIPFLEAFQRKFREFGGEAELLYPYSVLDAGEAGRQVESFLARGGQAVLLLTDATDTRTLSPMIRRVHDALPLLASTWVVPPWGAAHLGPMPEDLLISCTWDPDSTAPAYLKFKKQYEERFNTAVDYHAVHAYEALTLVAQALKAEGRRGNLARALTKIGTFQGLQGPIRIDPYGDCQRDVYVLRVRNGVLHRAELPGNAKK